MKKCIFSFIFLLAFIMMMSVLCCTRQHGGPIYIKNGKEYGKTESAFFRHRWWSYYERGLSYAEGQFYQEAAADLKEAIEQREKDQRMAPTYGMHFIDYFPHREWGIIQYQMGNFDAAETELKLSLSHFPTAKARFYLDRVRKALIEQEAREVPPPRLFIDLETHEVWTREDPVVISGEAEDEHYVTSVSIRGGPLFLEGSEKRVRFKERLALSQGRHVIDVEAKNLMGSSTKRQMIIHVDREGPLITIDELVDEQKASGSEAVISGFLHDEAGVSDLFINEQDISIEEGIEVHFSVTLILDGDSLNVVALDRLGNQTSAEISLAPASFSRTPIRLACANPDEGSDFVAELFVPGDTHPPDMRLNGWTDTQTVFMERVYLEGHVMDESKIDSLTINHIPILRKKGQSIFFSHMAELRKGENTITIEARDEAGNTAKKKISVIRQVPKAFQLDERLSLSVLPFEHKGIATQASLSFQDSLIKALVDQDRFRLVERDKLDSILQELGLRHSMLFDRRTALHLGRIVAAQSIITGTIMETRSGIEIVGRMIDTETSDIMATEDVYNEAKDLPALKALAEGMAVKFHREFPLVDGLVIDIREGHIFTDMGQDKIKSNRRLVVYREEPVQHPITGKVLGADNVIIEHAWVTQVGPEMSKAEIRYGRDQNISRMDKVITE